MLFYSYSSLLTIPQHRTNLYRNPHRHSAVAAFHNAVSSDRPSRQNSSSNNNSKQQPQPQRRMSNKRYSSQQNMYRSAQPMLSDVGIANYRTMDSSHPLLLQQQQQQQQELNSQKRGFISRCFSTITCGICSCL